MMNQSKYQLLIIAVASLLVLLANSWGYPIYILDEVKNAQCAKEMLLSDNWIVPTFNGELRTDKPPLHYYFIMVGYQIFGFNPLGARFFSAIFGTLTILSTFIITKKYVNEKAAKVAAVVLLSSIGFVAEYHLSVPDPYLIFFLTGALFSYFHYTKSKKNLYLYLMYMAMGFAFLTKGPIGVLFPILGIFFYMLAKKQLKVRNIKKLKIFWGVIIILIISLPWYVSVHLMTDGAWTEGFFLKHNIGRYTSSNFGHGSGFYLPTLFVLVAALPFSVFLVQSLHKPFKYRLNDLAILSLSYFTIILLFFSLSSNKLFGYVAPLLPFIAIMTGNFLGSVNSSNWKTSKMTWSIGVLLFLCISIPIAGYLAMRDNKELSGINHYGLVLTPLFLGAVVILVFLLKKSLKGIVIAVATSFIFTVNLVFYLLIPKIASENPVKESIELLNKAPKVAYYRGLNSAYVLEYGKVIPRLESKEEVASFLDRNPKAIIITQKKHLKSLGEMKVNEIYRKDDLIDGKVTVILGVE